MSEVCFFQSFPVVTVLTLAHLILVKWLEELKRDRKTDETSRDVPLFRDVFSFVWVPSDSSIPEGSIKNHVEIMCVF